MRPKKTLYQVAVMLLVMVISYSAVHAESFSTQRFTLHPGWNAVFLEVQPIQNSPVNVFKDLPVESVWTWLDQHSPVEFIQNPDEGLWNKSGWYAYFPDEKKGFLTTLFAVIANQAYLIKLTGDEDKDWTVNGPPSVKRTKWVPDSFNLLGFHVNAETPPTFKDFFSASPAHVDQPIYKLNTQGKWELVQAPSSLTIKHGEAYWVYCKGSSSFQAPLEIQLPMYDGLNYGSSITQLTITVNNISEVTRSVKLKLSSSDVVLAYKQYDPSTGYFSWPLLEQMPPVVLAPHRQANIQLTVKRESMSTGLIESVLTIEDDKGIKTHIPVIVEKIG